MESGCNRTTQNRGDQGEAQTFLHPIGDTARIPCLMKLNQLLSTMSLLSFLGIQSASAADIGTPAPSVISADENGKPVDFSAFYTKGITLVYFYPKADTPGCTAQACSLRDSFASLQMRSITILGVSGDKPAAQKAFKEKYNLPFTLVADADGAVAKAFGVPSFLGFTKRQSFLVKGGKVVWRDLSVSPKTHVAEVNEALDALK